MPQETGTFVGAAPAPVTLAPVAAESSPRYTFSAAGVFGGAVLQVKGDFGSGEYQFLPDVYVDAHRETWAGNIEGPVSLRVEARYATDKTDLTFYSNRVG